LRTNQRIGSHFEPGARSSEDRHGLWVEADAILAKSVDAHASKDQTCPSSMVFDFLVAAPYGPEKTFFSTKRQQEIQCTHILLRISFSLQPISEHACASAFILAFVADSCGFSFAISCTCRSKCSIHEAWTTTSSAREHLLA
jgi:hypothetical protein